MQDSKAMREKNEASIEMLNQNELRMSEQAKKISALEEQLTKQKEQLVGQISELASANDQIK